MCVCVCVCVCAYIYIYFITDHTLSSIIRSNSKSPNQGLQSRKKPKYLYFPYNSSYFINWVKDNNPNYPNPNFASKSRWKNKFSTLNSQTKKKKKPFKCRQTKGQPFSHSNPKHQSWSPTTTNKIPWTIEVEREQCIGSNNWAGRFSIEEQIGILTLGLDFLYRKGWLQLQLKAERAWEGESERKRGG